MGSPGFSVPFFSLASLVIEPVICRSTRDGERAGAVRFGVVDSFFVDQPIVQRIADVGIEGSQFLKASGTGTAGAPGEL